MHLIRVEHCSQAERQTLLWPAVMHKRLCRMIAKSKTVNGYISVPVNVFPVGFHVHHWRRGRKDGMWRSTRRGRGDTWIAKGADRSTEHTTFFLDRAVAISSRVVIARYVAIAEKISEFRALTRGEMRRRLIE